jgi:hypothetical protein
MAGTVGVDEVEAPEGLFAVGFMSGDFADAGGVFEAGSGEAGGTVDPAVFADTAEQGESVGATTSASESSRRPSTSPITTVLLKASRRSGSSRTVTRSG